MKGPRQAGDDSYADAALLGAALVEGEARLWCVIYHKSDKETVITGHVVR